VDEYRRVKGILVDNDDLVAIEDLTCAKGEGDIHA
jgi:hypothetical protein